MSAQGSRRILVLPSRLSREAFFCTLHHGRTGILTRFLIDPHNGIHEVTCVSAPKTTPRSWLVTYGPSIESGSQLDQQPSSQTKDHKLSCNIDQDSQSMLISKSELLVATPINPLFLLLPVLEYYDDNGKTNNVLYLSLDDILDKAIERSKDLEKVLRYDLLREKFRESLRAISDTVEAGNECMYRLSTVKLLAQLLRKAKLAAKPGLPNSLEERFIRRALDLPVTEVQTRNESETGSASHDSIISQSESTSSNNSQQSSESIPSLSSEKSVATEVTVPDELGQGSEPELQHLLRTRTALDFLISSYIPAGLANNLLATIKSHQGPVDFGPLDQRLEYVAKIRAETLAARSLGDFSRKRNAYEEDDAAEVRAEKRRKKEEEEKRKKLESKATRDLKKVDTTGMKKMNQFFIRKSPRKK